MEVYEEEEGDLAGPLPTGSGISGQGEKVLHSHLGSSSKVVTIGSEYNRDVLYQLALMDTRVDALETTISRFVESQNQRDTLLLRRMGEMMSKIESRGLDLEALLANDGPSLTEAKRARSDRGGKGMT